MNISYNWLKQFINLQEDPQIVAAHLTSIGLEVGTVEKVQTIKGGLEGLQTAQVLTCQPHPNSDHLHITTVLLQENTQPVQIVCGAPNVAAGQKVICATIGTTLYSGDDKFTIKKSKIRGVESFGMLCAEDEIGIGNNHDGIIVLPPDTPVGIPAKQYYNIQDDYIIEVDITPNRADACSHYGVARDLYAYYKAHSQNITLTKPTINNFHADNHNLQINIQVLNQQACPRYSAVSIQNIQVKDSPEWLQNALRTIGLRPINNIVDATNYVLHSFGQPMHAFDADKIIGNTIVVRNAQDNEPFTTLDGQQRKLNKADLMICNQLHPMCIAGVFGGLDSGVTQHTTNILLESAYFDPVSIRKTARRHALSTDASFRYERGADPNITIYALQFCANLIKQIAGGQIAMDIVDIKQHDFPPFPVQLNLEKTYQLIGKNIGKETVENILQALEISFHTDDNNNYQLLVPQYRVDVQRPCDVVEDILRIYGYNNIEFPQKVNTNLVHGKQPDPVFLQRRISEQLTAQGFREIMNNSLTKINYYEQSEQFPIQNCVKIKNPLSQDLAVLRQTLLFGGLESIQRNANRQNANLQFYEFGNTYHFQQDQHLPDNPLNAYSEQPHLAIWLTGNKTPQSWVRKDEPTSFYQLHAYVLNILKRIGIDTEKCTYQEVNNSLFTDSLSIVAPNNKQIGFIGIVAQKTLKQFDINAPVYYADLNFNTLLQLRKQFHPIISDLPKFPEVRRDFALLVDKSVKFADLKNAALKTERKLLKEVFLFDVYEGKNLDINKKSYALAFILQDPQNTLKDQQIDNIMQQLKNMYQQQFNAILR